MFLIADFWDVPDAGVWRARTHAHTQRQSFYSWDCQIMLEKIRHILILDSGLLLLLIYNQLNQWGWFSQFFDCFFFYMSGFPVCDKEFKNKIKQNKIKWPLSVINIHIFSSHRKQCVSWLEEYSVTKPICKTNKCDTQFETIYCSALHNTSFSWSRVHVNNGMIILGNQQI